VAFGDVLGIFFMRFRQTLIEAREGWAGGVRSHRALLEALRDRICRKRRRLWIDTCSTTGTTLNTEGL